MPLLLRVVKVPQRFIALLTLSGDFAVWVRNPVQGIAFPPVEDSVIPA